MYKSNVSPLSHYSSAHLLSINHDLNLAEIRRTSTGRIATVPKDNVSFELPSRRNRKDGFRNIDGGSNDGPTSAALPSLNKLHKKKMKCKITSTIHPIGTAVTKPFIDPETGEERPYSGFIISYDSKFKLYKIRYDEDGDEEEVDVKELEVIIAVNETLDESRERDNEIQASTSKKRKRKVVYYAESSESDYEVESEGDTPPRKKRTSGKTGNIALGSGKEKKSDDDSDDFMPDSEQEKVSDESDFDVESDDEKPKRAKKRRNKEAIALDKKVKPKSKKMCDSYKPSNNPVFWDKNMTSQQIKEKFTFLDPCGMEATDDIIDRLVGEQLDKIVNLLKRSLTLGALGSQKNPLVLGTACSGTDAPALALTIVQQQLEKRGMCDLFKHEHGKSRITPLCISHDWF